MKPFADPQLLEPTPLTVRGQYVWGHVAAWGTEHIGAHGVSAPRSASGYRYFHLGAYQFGDQELDVGQITLHTGHAGLRLPADEARKAYEDTGTVAAYVRCGEDAHGIWCSGCLALSISESDREALRGAKLSGDWRPINGKLELIGILAVCIPGFPIPRPHALIATGSREPLALVAAGIVHGSDARLRLRARVARRRLAVRVASAHDAQRTGQGEGRHAAGG